jgi:hypothetical protein
MPYPCPKTTECGAAGVTRSAIPRALLSTPHGVLCSEWGIDSIANEDEDRCDGSQARNWRRSRWLLVFEKQRAGANL